MILRRSIMCMFFLALPVFAQTPTGKITGRVVADDGQPLANAVVSLMGISGENKVKGGFLTVSTDNDGNFIAEGLDSLPFILTAQAAGYVPTTIGPLHSATDRPVHIGESLQITLLRGGVITGKVTNAAGEPVIDVGVLTSRERDEKREPVGKEPYHRWARTDDRGIYRIYGLAPGEYAVWAGKAPGSSIRPTPYLGKTPTYHPSSTRDTASLVRVTNGQEATGIDIRYRGEPGFAVSGKVRGVAPRLSSVMYIAATIQLRNLKTGDVYATGYSLPANDHSYVIYGIPNGEYEILAEDEQGQDGNAAASAPRRITIKGADLTGVDLALVPKASISGVAKIETSTEKCPSPRESQLSEVILKPRLDEPAQNKDPLREAYGNITLGVPDEKGAFKLRNLNPGRHRIEADLPDETWYLKSITPAAPIVLKAGEKRSGLNVIIATGAASLTGKAKSGTHLKLSPAEKEFKDDPLRQYETVAADDKFAFRNLAPGKYQLTADEKSQAVELKGCQKRDDLVVK